MFLFAHVLVLQRVQSYIYKNCGLSVGMGRWSQKESLCRMLDGLQVGEITLQTIQKMIINDLQKTLKKRRVRRRM